MKQLTNKAARRYLRQVRRLLPCSPRERKRITEALQRSLEAYLMERPEATLPEIQARFGSPESVASMCLQESALPTTVKQLRLRRRIWLLASSIALVILLTWVGYLIYIHYTVQAEIMNGYYVDSISIESTSAE